MTAKQKSLPAHLADPDEAPEVTDAWVREADLYEGDKLIRQAIHRLRRKIEVDPTQPKHLVNIRGLGYRFDA